MRTQRAKQLEAALVCYFTVTALKQANEVRGGYEAFGRLEFDVTRWTVNKDDAGDVASWQKPALEESCWIIFYILESGVHSAFDEIDSTRVMLVTSDATNAVDSQPSRRTPF